MPQMMPLNWMMSFMSINMILLILSIIIFNMFLPKMNNNNKNKTFFPNNKWMW